MFDPYDHYEDFVDQKVTLHELASAHGVTRDHVRVSLRNIAKELGEFNLYINAIRRKMPPVWAEEEEEPNPQEIIRENLVRLWFESGMSNRRFRDKHGLGVEFREYCRDYCRRHGIDWVPKNGSYCVTEEEKLKRGELFSMLSRAGETYASIGRRHNMWPGRVKQWIEDYERSQV